MFLHFGTHLVIKFARKRTMKIFNTQKIQLLKQSLDVYSRQHEAISKNIANANESNFKRTETDFSTVLRQDMDRRLKVTNPKHIEQSNAPAQRGMSGTGEKVDLSNEMGKLAENQIRYDFSARVLARAYKSLSTSIIGRNS